METIERTWHKNGQLASELRYVDDQLHNNDGPAVRGWDARGELIREEYWRNNRWCGTSVA